MEPEVLTAMEKSMLAGVIPSNAAAAALVAAVVGTEVVCILAGEEVPGRRDPVCLPDVTVVDLLQQRIEIVPIDDLERSEA
jgi:hypothetical protein